MEKTVIFWDFDGVILQSNEIRDQGFELTLEEFPQSQVEQLLQFHRQNGGLSRYVKFRYFFEDIRGEELDKKSLINWTDAFSSIMRKELVKKELLIKENIAFIRDNQDKYTMFVVSGSDQNELRYLCNQLKLTSLFKGIYGSPTPKVELVRNLLLEEQLNPASCFLVGDSINDYEAAEANGVDFFAYNNPDLNQFPQFIKYYLNA